MIRLRGGGGYITGTRLYFNLMATWGYLLVGLVPTSAFNILSHFKEVSASESLESELRASRDFGIFSFSHLQRGLHALVMQLDRLPPYNFVGAASENNG